MELEHRQTVGPVGHRFFDVFCILVEDRLSSRDNLRDDREAITGGGPGKDRPVPPIFLLEDPPSELPSRPVLSSRYAWMLSLA